MPARPKFSIAIPVYNRPDYLRQALRSCLLQTVEDFEVVVSDDCSDENLKRVVDGFRDARLRYDRSLERLGATRNHQRAASLARGEYVITLNSDDMLLPDCLAAAGDVLDRHEKAAAVYFSCTYATGEAVGGAHPMPRLDFADGAAFAQNPWLADFHGTSPSCVLMRKSSFDKVGGYRVALRFAYDWDLYRRLAGWAGGVCFLPRILALYRHHGEQMIQTVSLDGLLDMLDLWGSDTLYRFAASDMALLVLAQSAAALRTKKGLPGMRSVWHHVAQRGLTGQVLAGLPGALAQKARHRLGLRGRKADPNYRQPENVADAIAKAHALLSMTA